MYYTDSLNHSFTTSKKSLSPDEVASLTCSATIRYPPLTSISILKNNITVSTTPDSTLTVSTDHLGVSPYGLYQCILNATGVTFSLDLMIKDEGTVYVCVCVCIKIIYAN